ncbi:hypothetical protein VTN02DRAFT_4528 [Thermoascus thermophilus]
MGDSKETSRHTNQIDDAVSDTQGARGLDTAADVLDLRAQVPAAAFPVALAGIAVALELGEEGLGQRREARDDVLPDQLPRVRDGSLLGHLHLQPARAESQVQHLLDPGGLPAGQVRIVLGDLVAAGDAQIDAALAHEGGDVGGGQEDERDGEVLDEGDVETGFTAELDVAPGQQV